MCIALLTTSHPEYALIAIDNRDEYILRPTSRPHWWKAQVETSSSSSPSKPAEVEVLSSRDLQRAERGTWLGITKGGNFAVLTNYRETDTHDSTHPVHGKRSRGGMVTAWLAANPTEPIEEFVRRMLEGGDVKGVGGFSLICGKLRKANGGQGIKPLAILSNRHDHVDHVPWICTPRGCVYGLSNTTYSTPENTADPAIWPKIRLGSNMLAQVSATKVGCGETELLDALFEILDVEDFPSTHDMDLEEGIPLLKNSIFVPAFGGKEHQDQMKEARALGKTYLAENDVVAEELAVDESPDKHPNGFQTGLYGTQRQTVVLVDWEGNVTYKERSLWDSNGNPIARGHGDMTFRFQIDGWEDGAGVSKE